MVLHLGKMTTKELAEWFGISENTYRRKQYKEKRLEILKRYAKYHLEGTTNKTVYIDEIYEDTYIAEEGSPAFLAVKELTSQNWDESGYDTCSNVNDKIYPQVKSKGHEIKKTTSYYYVCKGRSELYGSPLNHTGGSLGHCHYEWCKKDENGKYQPLTEEEKEIKRIISKKYDLDNDDITFLVARIKAGKMSKEELWEYYQGYKTDVYMNWKAEVEKALGFILYQVTKVELFPNPKEGDFNF